MGIYGVYAQNMKLPWQEKMVYSPTSHHVHFIVGSTCKLKLFLWMSHAHFFDSDRRIIPPLSCNLRKDFSFV